MTSIITLYSVIVEDVPVAKSKPPSATDCCQIPPLKDRPLISPIRAGGLAAAFKVLANDPRFAAVARPGPGRGVVRH